MNTIRWIRARWWALWSAQVLGLFVLAVLLVTISGAFGADMLRVLYPVAVWLAYPLAGIYATVSCVRHGLNAYLGWIALPLGLGIAQLIATATHADAGLIMIYALLGVISAATGEELQKRGKRADTA